METGEESGTDILFRQLAEQSFVGVYIVQDGKFIYANSRMAEIFGYPLGEFIGKTGPEQVIHTEDWPDIRVKSRRRLMGEVERDYYSFRGVKKDKTIIYCEVYGSVVSFHGRRAVTGIVNDITARTIAETSLNRELERKKDFITVAAHELRTPLQPILTYLYLMLEDPAYYGINEQGIKAMEQLKASADKEVAIVNRLLELSLLEIANEKTKPVIKTVSPHDLINLILKSRKIAEVAEVTVTIPCDLVIATDVDYLFEIFAELVGNAILYSNPPRCITLAYSEDGKFSYFSIRDNGIGISPDELSNIFSPFYLADAPKLSRKYGRLGLGLTLANEKIAILGGEILVESTPGKGSTFTIKIPKNC